MALERSCAAIDAAELLFMVTAMCKNFFILNAVIKFINYQDAVRQGPILDVIGEGEGSFLPTNKILQFIDNQAIGHKPGAIAIGCLHTSTAIH